MTNTGLSEASLALRDLRGLVATVVISGFVDEHYAVCHEEMRAWNIENGFASVEYRKFDAKLVEQGRDSAVAHALSEGYDYLLQIDADAAPFSPNSLAHVLTTAYITIPAADVVGAYCQLRGEPYLPTIDTGTGTWEPHWPGEGILPVIRTGGHFLLTKTPLLERMGAPWFRTRLTQRPIDALAEIDNYARVKLHGKNPFADTPEWKELMRHARLESQGEISGVGEDSGFCDRALANGARLYVDTGIVVGHVSKRTLLPEQLTEALQLRERTLDLLCGVLTPTLS